MDGTDAAAGSRQRVVGLADLIRIPVHRWRIVAAVTALVTLAVVGYLKLVPASYTGTSVVVVRAVVADPFVPPSGGADRAVNMTAENGIATSNEVIDATAGLTGRTPEEVRTALTVEVPVGGQVLRFSFVADSASQAAVGANAAAQTYLRVREALYQDQRATLLRSYDETAASVTEQRSAIQRGLPPALSQNTSSPSTQAVLDQVRALNDQLAQLAEQRAKLASANLSPGVVTTTARAPVPSSHDAAVWYLLGAVLGGLVLGAVLAYARESLDRRVRSVAEAAEVTGLPVLGTIRARRFRNTTAVVADARYASMAVAEAVESAPTRFVVVLSSRDDEGRTRVAGSLAIALAEAGHDVYLGSVAARLGELRRLIVEAQHRASRSRALGPRTAEMLEPPTTAPATPATPATPAQRTAVIDSDETPAHPGPAGRRSPSAGPAAVTVADLRRTVSDAAVPPTPPEFGSSPERKISELLPVGDGYVRLGSFGNYAGHSVVVLDAPPADADERGVRAAQSGVAVLVAARDRSRCAQLGRLAGRLRALGVPAVGLVVTGDGRG